VKIKKWFERNHLKIWEIEVYIEVFGTIIGYSLFWGFVLIFATLGR